jgi:hypothetical protein
MGESSERAEPQFTQKTVHGHLRGISALGPDLVAMVIITAHVTLNRSPLNC